MYASPPLSDTAKSNALDNYFAWCEHIEEDGNYTDFRANDLPKPYEGESLIEYMIRLSQVVEERGWGIKRKRRALKSFLHFLRKDYHQEAVAFIEHIFPEKIGLKNKKIFKKISLPVSFPLQGFTGKALIELRKKTIIRKIRPQVHSISREIAGAIIKELAYQCAFGRSNARHHAGEALALIWLCISSSRIRWPRSLESVHGLGADSIVFDKEFPELLAPRFFGPHPVRIGERVARIFQAVANIPSKTPRKMILQTSLPDLRKPLNTAVQNANPFTDLGEITFLTFLSYPHHFGKDIR